MNLQHMFLTNHIEVGSVRVKVTLGDNLTNGQVRTILSMAIHAMQDTDLSEIFVKTTGYSKARDLVMNGFGFFRYGPEHLFGYRLIDAEETSENF
jgi:hypothetical protein